MTRRNPPAKWVLPTVINPPKRRCFVIEVPDEPQHVAAFRGAMLDLASAYKWADDPLHKAREVALVWRDVIDAMRDCEICIPPSGGVDEGVEQMIRQNPDNPCLLESSINGTDWCVFADLSLCLSPGPQPGAGAEQPRPGGGCASYQGILNANQTWLLPALVNSGDTLELTRSTGAANDGGTPAWYCPNGYQFIAGICLPPTLTNGGDPLPAQPHMCIIAKIGANYYNISSGVFTVPGGITGEAVLLQVNDGGLSNNSGSYDFTIKVCNNQVATWESLSDFSLSPYGWTAYVCAGDCGNACNAGAAGIYGSGVWTATLFGCSNQYFDMPVSPLFDARYIVSVQVLVNAASAIPSDGFGSGLFVTYYDGTGAHGIFPSTSLAAGDNLITLPVNAPNVTRIRVNSNSQSTTVRSTIKSIKIVGQGAKPSQLP